VNDDSSARPQSDGTDAGRERSAWDAIAALDADRPPASELPPVNEPELSAVLGNGLGLSETDLHVYVCLRERGGSTTKEVAERLDLDRSTVARSLNRLAEPGLVEGNHRVLESGGRVNVYSISRAGAFADRLRRGLLAWAAGALDRLEEFTDSRWRRGSDESVGVYWDA